MKRDTIALFGEAERGEFKHAYWLYSLPEVLDVLGEPPEHSHGVNLAIQSILYDKSVLYFRVEEEGFSFEDYYFALKFIESQDLVLQRLLGLCAPGVGDCKLLKLLGPVCEKTKSLLIVSESDFYDYLTC